MSSVYKWGLTHMLQNATIGNILRYMQWCTCLTIVFWRCSQKWTIQRNWQHMIHKTKKNKNKNTTRYMLDTTIPNQANSLNKTWALLKTTVIYLIHNLASYKVLHRESTLYMIQHIDTWLFQHQPDILSSIHLYSTASYMEVSEWYRGWYGKSLVLICNHADKSLYFNHICSNQIF